MSLRAHLIIKLSHDLSIALEKALKPDNEILPKGFKIKTYINNEGFHLLLKFKGEANSTAILTSLSIIDEVTQLAKSLAEAIAKAVIANSYKPSIIKEE